MKNSGGPHQMRPTQPPTRDPRPVDNSPRYWAGRTGIVHRTVRWSPCSSGLFAGRWRDGWASTSPDLPAGDRCPKCFPTTEVPHGRNRTGWPRDHHPTPETTR